MLCLVNMVYFDQPLIYCSFGVTQCPQSWFGDVTVQCEVMSRLVVIVVLFFEMSSSVSKTNDNSYSSDNNEAGPVWTYDDEKKWPGNRCQGGGKRQSPIDIKIADVITDFNKDFIKYGPLRFVGYQQVLVTGINNGHTIQFSTEGSVEMHPTTTGGPLKHVYRLEQLHFHWLSEHSIDGVKYPMEIHFVHVRSDLSVYEALKKRDGLAIVSVFSNVQVDLEDNQDVTEEIMRQMPDLMETGDRVSGVILNMTKLLSPGRDYLTYAGSLTSPQCNEAVIWIIFKTPINMSDAQYRMFGKIGVGRHNFRSLQKLNRHQVFQPPYTALHTPVIVVFFEKMAKVVADFFRNITSFISKGFKTR